MAFTFANKLAENIFKLRYAFDANETWEEASRRVSSHVAKAEEPSKQQKYEDEFYDELSNGRFMPGGRIWYGAGRNKAQLLNCYVLGGTSKDDSREGWGKLLHDCLIISGTGGGFGSNYSEIRPRGMSIMGTGGESTGPVSLMRIVNGVCEEIKAGGNRRSAIMMCLNHDHPDISEFLNAKLEHGEINNANISIVFMNESPEDFFEKVRNDADHNLMWKGKVVKTIKATELWNLLVKNALKNGEPGILNGFMANEQNNIWYARKLTSTNPCGEIFMAENGNCCLGAVVLPRFVKKDSKAKNVKDRFDWEALHTTVGRGIRFLDDVLTVNHYPIPETEAESKAIRRLGLGVMGLHDMLLMLGLKYSSQEGRDFVDKVMSFIKHTAYDTSTYLAVEKGPFPEFNAQKFLQSGFVKSLKPSVRNKIRDYGMRNCAVLTIAPTGCQTSNTLLVSKDGIEELGEIVNLDGPQWGTNNKEMLQDNGQYILSDKTFVNGFSVNKKLKLKSGIDLEASIVHQFRVIENGNYNWKTVDEINVNDILGVKIGGYNKTEEPILKNPEKTHFNDKKISFPSKMNPDLAWLLGLYFADGSNHKKGIRIHLNSSESNYNEDVIKRIKNTFNFEPTVIHDRGCAGIYLNSQRLIEFLSLNDCLKQKSLEVKIPKIIRTSSSASLQSFIDGYWFGDGSKTGNTKYIDTVSYTMAQQLAVIKRALGQNVNISTINDRSKSKGSNPMYRVYDVGFGSENFDKLRYISKEEKATSLNVKNASGLDIFFDKVVSTEYSESTTVDISVPNSETYIANSVVSHNTTSMVQGASSGIESLFSYAYERKYKVNNEDGFTEFKTESVTHPLFQEFVEGGLDVSHFEGSDDISPRDHFMMQVVCQEHVDNAISKTVNVPQDKYTPELLSDLYMEFIPQLKGTTIYPVGSRPDAPLTPIPLDVAYEMVKNGIAKKEEEQIDSCTSGTCGL